MSFNEILLRSLKRAMVGGVLLAALWMIKTIWW
jgi:hypothetical protein